MNDFANLEKTIVRELSCRLCLCTDVVKLKPLSGEIKRRIKRLFDIVIRNDDSLPKAICHECLQQVGALHLYAIKVEKTQKFLEFHKLKANEKRDQQYQHGNTTKLHPLATVSAQNLADTETTGKKPQQSSSPPAEHQQGDAKLKPKAAKKKSPADMKFLESMPLEEFATAEKLDKTLLNSTAPASKPDEKKDSSRKEPVKEYVDYTVDTLDPIVIIDGRPAKQGAALDKQITLFYKMECCICHENGFHFRSLMKHYKERHGVPGCHSCHQNFQTSQELVEHQSNGGRSEGKIICPRCQDRYPTYHELGLHLTSHRSDKMQCDYCGKLLKHHHRKKTVNHMENVILCSQCVRSLKNIEKQDKEIKEKMKAKSNDAITLQKYKKFQQAMGLSGDEDASTD
ncbi:hypothetical protein MSG28_011108 [Choristoneura fumiferana]|uniref:Uncharacterized protein n=1 Tax=Choristoneura fumiferana TaxID=7141 RepID=A0ACC0KR95_CHOFU|nr:hypothetical protein MSG28_011108 [Choristoneura fumiferana]